MRMRRPRRCTAIRPDVGDEVVNSLSTYLDCTPLEKQFLLEAEHVFSRPVVSVI